MVNMIMVISEGTGSITLKIPPFRAVAAGEAVFTIDSIAYTLNGEENEMDVAQYIKDDRLLPARCVLPMLLESVRRTSWDPGTDSNYFQGRPHCR